MVKMAGQAKTKLTRPKSNEASRASSFEAQAWRKIVDEVECLRQQYQRPTKGSVEAKPYDDINTAHLLGDHDGEGSKARPAHSWNCKELHKALEVVAVSDDVLLNLDLCADVR